MQRRQGYIRDILTRRISKLVVGLEQGVVRAVIALAEIVETVIIVIIHCTTIIPSSAISTTTFTAVVALAVVTV